MNSLSLHIYTMKQGLTLQLIDTLHPDIKMLPWSLSCFKWFLKIHIAFRQTSDPHCTPSQSHFPLSLPEGSCSSTDDLYLSYFLNEYAVYIYIHINSVLYCFGWFKNLCLWYNSLVSWCIHSILHFWNLWMLTYTEIAH